MDRQTDNGKTGGLTDRQRERQYSDGWTVRQTDDGQTDRRQKD